MGGKSRFAVLVLIGSLAAVASCAEWQRKSKPQITSIAGSSQAPTWSEDDRQFFLHGSMSTEFVPKRVLKAFIKTYPDLFPKGDLSEFGLIPDGEWPIGFSEGRPEHLGRLPSVGINCASCHVDEVHSTDGGRVRVIGVASHFDAEAFFGAVLGATFRTEDPANMKRFLGAYFGAEPNVDVESLRAALSQPVAVGLQPIDVMALDDSRDPVRAARAVQVLFHNIRTALHVSDEPPKQAPPASGPGRNDAFGLLAATLFNSPQPYAPVKYGIVWNLDRRQWVHWDGNTRSPIARNMLASLGLGAPLIGKKGQLDFKLVERHTKLSEEIRPPKYPFEIDQTAASRGQRLFEINCAKCHAGPESDDRLYAPADVGTDPTRARVFTSEQANHFNEFLMSLETTGYVAPKVPGIRSTGKYWSPNLAGVWARSPYLHNGSVRTMSELLTKPADRPESFKRGSREYDERAMGFVDQGAYEFDTTKSGNSNAGHDYGTALTDEQKRALMEYLKTL